jgi:molybdenum cofactor biosynthesis enzyme MoaA
MQVTVAQKPITTRVLPRGNWQDETGEVVEPATPHFCRRCRARATADGRPVSTWPSGSSPPKTR